ncbi:uncharacterized protein MONOS_5987 [Monocercomonoides exilis]|uniref:uncharacterized protein n=1 Tax=Monocercomonoides exilis TaxID=2049356 RepID=UPI00355A2DBB|nr:hypothetical protein MONOS_5987 [Monocercomonoides exilis]|eukprot:MONOS_5987.1-p1 / transcript=MONOS_5987.1 / gene=MONOS_5987 / organism=Monocercomonoides_exilis_PA203 / gene_product=unspecified product / transcript_product=unspecified product / location=Mono_scaffold00182:27943-28272(-) / protein_length=110 / sequence_SO=supercontig / SO=protein_coding / is_pseudo=false
MADTLLSTVDNRKPQSQMCLQDRNDYAQSAQTTSTNFPKGSEGETIFPNQVEEPGEKNRDNKEILVERNQKGAVAILETMIGVRTLYARRKSELFYSQNKEVLKFNDCS